MFEIISLLGDGLLQSLSLKSIYDFRLPRWSFHRCNAWVGIGKWRGYFVAGDFFGAAHICYHFLAALYYGAMYGGNILNHIGDSGASTAVATVFDGKPMARQGMADQALMAAAIASFIGGTYLLSYSHSSPQLRTLR